MCDAYNECRGDGFRIMRPKYDPKEHLKNLLAQKDTLYRTEQDELREIEEKFDQHPWNALGVAVDIFIKGGDNPISCRTTIHSLNELNDEFDLLVRSFYDNEGSYVNFASVIKYHNYLVRKNVIRYVNIGLFDRTPEEDWPDDVQIDTSWPMEHYDLLFDRAVTSLTLANLEDQIKRVSDSIPPEIPGAKCVPDDEDDEDDD